MKKFPQHLTSPYQILWFEADEIGIFIVFLIPTLIFGGWFFLLAIAIPIIYGKIKTKYPRGFLRHIFYFIGFTNFKGYPIFQERKFFE